MQKDVSNPMIEDKTEIINNSFVLYLSFFREIQEDECLRQVYRLHGIDERTTNFSAPDILKDII